MTKEEKEFPVYVIGFAVSVTIMLILEVIGVVAGSESLVSAGTCFALTSAVFLAGAIYWGFKAVH